MDFSCSDPLYSKYEESCEMKAGDLQGLGQPEQQLLEEAEFLGGKGRAGAPCWDCIPQPGTAHIPSSAPQPLAVGLAVPRVGVGR